MNIIFNFNLSVLNVNLNNIKNNLSIIPLLMGTSGAGKPFDFNCDKDINDYIKKMPHYNPPRIDAETYRKYFSHIPADVFNWLTIEDIFKWKKGSMFAAARFKFHTSDNFLANGIPSKRALIAWTRISE